MVVSEYRKGSDGSCSWEVVKVVRLPATANFQDYSGMDFRGNKVGGGGGRGRGPRRARDGPAAAPQHKAGAGARAKRNCARLAAAVRTWSVQAQPRTLAARPVTAPAPA